MLRPNVIVLILLFVCTWARGNIELDLLSVLEEGEPCGSQTVGKLILYRPETWKPRASDAVAYKWGRYLFVLMLLNVSIRTGTPVLE